MTKNLEKALNENELTAHQNELEKVFLAATGWDSFDYAVEYTIHDIQGDVVKQAFGESHPSDYYDNYDTEVLKEFLNMGEEEASEIEDKWELLDNVRDKFRAYYVSQISQIDLYNNEHMNSLYNRYKEKFNPETTLTREEFLKALINYPGKINLMDTQYFNYDG